MMRSRSITHRRDGGTVGEPEEATEIAACELLKV